MIRAREHRVPSKIAATKVPCRHAIFFTSHLYRLRDADQSMLEEPAELKEAAEKLLLSLF